MIFFKELDVYKIKNNLLNNSFSSSIIERVMRSKNNFWGDLYFIYKEDPENELEGLDINEFIVNVNMQLERLQHLKSEGAPVNEFVINYYSNLLNSYSNLSNSMLINNYSNNDVKNNFTRNIMNYDIEGNSYYNKKTYIEDRTERFNLNEALVKSYVKNEVHNKNNFSERVVYRSMSSMERLFDIKAEKLFEKIYETPQIYHVDNSVLESKVEQSNFNTIIKDYLNYSIKNNVTNANAVSNFVMRNDSISEENIVGKYSNITNNILSLSHINAEKEEKVLYGERNIFTFNNNAVYRKNMSTEDKPSALGKNIDDISSAYGGKVLGEKVFYSYLNTLERVFKLDVEQILESVYEAPITNEVNKDKIEIGLYKNIWNNITKDYRHYIDKKNIENVELLQSYIYNSAYDIRQETYSRQYSNSLIEIYKNFQFANSEINKVAADMTNNIRQVSNFRNIEVTNKVLNINNEVLPKKGEAVSKLTSVILEKNTIEEKINENRQFSSKVVSKNFNNVKELFKDSIDNLWSNIYGSPITYEISTSTLEENLYNKIWSNVLEEYRNYAYEENIKIRNDIEKHISVSISKGNYYDNSYLLKRYIEETNKLIDISKTNKFSAIDIVNTNIENLLYIRDEKIRSLENNIIFESKANEIRESSKINFSSNNILVNSDNIISKLYESKEFSEKVLYKNIKNVETLSNLTNENLFNNIYARSNTYDERVISLEKNLTESIYNNIMSSYSNYNIKTNLRYIDDVNNYVYSTVKLSNNVEQLSSVIESLFDTTRIINTYDREDLTLQQNIQKSILNVINKSELNINTANLNRIYHDNVNIEKLLNKSKFYENIVLDKKQVIAKSIYENKQLSESVIYNIINNMQKLLQLKSENIWQNVYSAKAEYNTEADKLKENFSVKIWQSLLKTYSNYNYKENLELLASIQNNIYSQQYSRDNIENIKLFNNEIYEINRKIDLYKNNVQLLQQTIENGVTNLLSKNVSVLNNINLNSYNKLLTTTNNSEKNEFYINKAVEVQGKEVIGKLLNSKDFSERILFETIRGVERLLDSSSNTIWSKVYNSSEIVENRSLLSGNNFYENTWGNILKNYSKVVYKENIDYVSRIEDYILSNENTIVNMEEYKLLLSKLNSINNTLTNSYEDTKVLENIIDAKINNIYAINNIDVEVLNKVTSYNKKIENNILVSRNLIEDVNTTVLESKNLRNTVINNLELSERRIFNAVEAITKLTRKDVESIWQTIYNSPIEIYEVNETNLENKLLQNIWSNILKKYYNYSNDINLKNVANVQKHIFSKNDVLISSDKINILQENLDKINFFINNESLNSNKVIKVMAGSINELIKQNILDLDILKVSNDFKSSIYNFDDRKNSIFNSHSDKIINEILNTNLIVNEKFTEKVIFNTLDPLQTLVQSQVNNLYEKLYSGVNVVNIEKHNASRDTINNVFKEILNTYSSGIYRKNIDEITSFNNLNYTQNLNLKDININYKNALNKYSRELDIVRNITENVANVYSNNLLNLNNLYSNINTKLQLMQNYVYESSFSNNLDLKNNYYNNVVENLYNKVAFNVGNVTNHRYDFAKEFLVQNTLISRNNELIQQQLYKKTHEDIYEDLTETVRNDIRNIFSDKNINVQNNRNIDVNTSIFRSLNILKNDMAVNNYRVENTNLTLNRLMKKNETMATNNTKNMEYYNITANHIFHHTNVSEGIKNEIRDELVNATKAQKRSYDMQANLEYDVSRKNIVMEEEVGSEVVKTPTQPVTG